MKKNKKLLVSFLALNAILSAYMSAAPNQGNTKYSRLYNNIIKNVENGNSNNENYKTIEKILNKKNKELKDLYLQNDYVVKPEYLEWQVLSSGFYTKRTRGDNTMDNAKHYSVLETYSGKKTYNESAFNKLHADLRGTNLLSEDQLSAILAGHYNVINSLSLKDQKIVRGILNEGLSNISRTGGFKTYEKPQSTKEIDLGINIPPKVVNREPLNPNPTVPTAPSFNLPSFNPSAPEPPVVPTLTIKAFNPVSPLVTVPVLFTPPSLTYTAGGFGQTSQVVSQNQGGQGFMLGNYGVVSASIPIVINASNISTSYTGSIDVDGTMNPHGVLGQVSGTLSNGSYNNIMNAFYSMVGNFDTVMSGNYTVNNERSDGRTTIFISYNPYEVNTTDRSVKFIGTVSLNNSIYGGQNVLVGVEHQLLGCNNGGSFSCTVNRGNTSSIFENVAGSQIILNSGINMIGIMIDSEGTQLTKRSETINNGEIIIASGASKSIGIDFGQYQSSLSQFSPADPYVIVKTGNIIMNGENSYGLRVGNMFPTHLNYYNNVEIDGSNGNIMVNGNENVGVSLSKQITKVTGNLIGNITNLRVILNGNKGVGILRNKDYSSSSTGSITLNDTNIQNLTLGDNATNSILIRSDKYGVILNKTITINNTSVVNGAINNIVMTANDVNGLGSKLTFVENNSTITLGNNLSKATGLLSVNGGHSLNTGTIIIDSKESQGMTVFGDLQGTVATSENKGTISVNGEGSVGVYNEGIFEMTGGAVNVSGNKGIGIYAKNGSAVTNISDGIIEASNGGIGLYADDKGDEGNGATIKLSGNAQLNVKSKGLMLYNYSGTTGIPVGKFDITGTINAIIDSQGTAFYFKGIPNDTGSFLTHMITGSGKLNIKLTDPTSSLFVLDSPGGIINLSDATISGIVNNLPVTVTIDTLSDLNFKPYSVFKGALNINMNVNIDDPTDAYNRSEFISSKVNLLTGQTMTSTTTGKYAIGQENYDNNNGRGDVAVTVDSGGLINMSGSNSAGIIINYGVAVNNGQISMTGNESIGIVSYNGSLAQNKGIIKVGAKGTGIYGENKAQSYGDKKIEIENHGLITTTAGIVTDASYGIFAKNTMLSRADSTIKLFSGSEINMSQQNKGVGVSAEKSVITSDGKITVGENGLAIYADDTEVNINSGEINLNGNNAVGFHLKNSVLNGNSGVINVNGQNVVLFNLDNSTFTNNLTVNAAPGSSYVVGNIKDGIYTHGASNTLHSNSLLLNGKSSAILLDSNSNISSSGTGVVAVSVDGVYFALPLPLPYTVEAENKGIINLGDSSAGIYGRNGAGIKNSGLITLGSGSVGLYASGAGSNSENTGTIELGNNSTGMYQENGNNLQNKNKITSLPSFSGAVGIYTKNNTGIISNAGTIELSGDKSIGIYAGGGTQDIDNSGIIKLGDSVLMNNPSIGIYTNNLTDTVTNTGTIETGVRSLGIYSLGTIVNHNNSGVIKVGSEGTGIYKDGGTLNINSGSKIIVNSSEAVGIYGINNSNTDIKAGAVIEIDSGSYGAIVESGSNLTNYTIINLVNNSIFTYGNGAGTVTNNGQININGSDNTVFYMIKAGNMVNKSNIDVLSGTGNIGMYNRGVYTKENLRPDGTIELEGLLTEGSIVNDANISMGDSFLITNSHGIKTGYSVGIYAEGSSAVNNFGKTITIGSEGVGMYVRDAVTTSYNYGIIKGTGNKAIGIFADNTRVENRGIIDLNGDEVIGIAGRNGAYIYNGGIIKVTGKNVTGIYLSGENTKVENKGKIIITNTGDLEDDQGVGIKYTENFNENHIIGGTGDISGTAGGYLTAGSTTQSYRLPELPTLINSGEINIEVGNRFSYDGMKVIIKLDPVTNDATTNASDIIGFSGTTIPEKLEIAADFSQGTSADRYTFRDIFRGMDGTGEYISQSLTWDATGQGSDIVMTRIDYTKFTNGLWYEDFGKVLNERYANSTGDRMKIYDKIDMIQTEPDFRHAIASLAGNIYANINHREEDMARVFENSLQILENSSNNTKENVKINIIAGKGKTEEDTDGVVPYKYTSTGIQALREVERTYRHTFGYSAGYLHTGFEFEDNNDSEEWVDTIQLGLHNKYRLNNWKLKNDLTGRVSFHNVDRNIDWADQKNGTERSEMNGRYETYSITSDNVLGREINLGKKVSITPYGAFRAMYVTRLTFSESGLERLEVEGNDAWSVKPRAGVELKATTPLGKNTAWEIKGMLDLAYEYELSGLDEREKAKLIAVEDGYHKLSKPEDEKGSFRTKAAIGVEAEERYGIFLTGEYMAGNGDKDDYRAGVTLKAVF